MVCPRCKSPNVNIHAVEQSKTRHRGCIGWFFWILLAICTCGLILIIPAITNSKTKTKTRFVAVCNHCGKHWNT